MTKAMEKFIFGAVLAGSLMLASATGAAQAPASKMREVNLTTDSAPGWLPSEELEATALQTLARFFSFDDSGNSKEAYSMLNPGTRDILSFDVFEKDRGEFRAQAGKLRQRRIIKVTWTKDPANAPHPGVYAAVDASATFEGIDRQCGYVILYQAPQGGPFSVMRTENNYIDNASAKEIERTQSKAALDQLWTGLSTNCPNFRATGS